jgi:hypothetical protein
MQGLRTNQIVAKAPSQDGYLSQVNRQENSPSPLVSLLQAQTQLEAVGPRPPFLELQGGRWASNGGVNQQRTCLFSRTMEDAFSIFPAVLSQPLS